MTEGNLGDSPPPDSGYDEMPSFEEVSRQWGEMPEQQRARVMDWCNRWRAVEGGFNVLTAIAKNGRSYVCVEPVRASFGPTHRVVRKRINKLIEELKVAPDFARAVKISTIRVWYHTNGACPGETVQ